MATRREALQAGVGGTIAAAIGGAKGLVDRIGPPRTPYPTPTTGAAEGCEANALKVASPLIERGTAMARVFGDAVLRGQVRARLFEQYRDMNEIDPDLSVLKSLSPMAKLTMTRQRRVEREMQRIYTLDFDRNAPQPYSPMRDWLETHVRKLMWGHD